MDADAKKEEACPVCQSTRYINPNLKLLVSPCYHQICEPCVHRLFGHGASPCPVCKTTQLRRENWVVPTFEDLSVERECRIRRRISTIFNKQAEDFETLREYNDYLEEVEDLVFNLLFSQNLQETDARIEAYRVQNQDQINKINARLGREEREWRQREKEEQMRREQLMQEELAEMEQEEQKRRENEIDIINTLADSNEPAEAILKRKKQQQVQLDMPSFKGLKRKGGQSRVIENAGPFDPLDTVFELTLKHPLSSDFSNVDPNMGWESIPWSSSFSAGGFSLDLVMKQSLIAAFNW